MEWGRASLIAVTTLAAAAVVTFAYAAGGFAAGTGAAIAATCLFALRAGGASAAGRDRVARAGGAAIVLLPGALIVYLSFNAGGFFAATPAFAGVLLAVALIVRLSAGDSVPARPSLLWAIASIALTALAVWTAASELWADGSGRALVDAVWPILYLFTLLLVASEPLAREHLRWLVRGVLGGVALVCTIALVSLLLPDVLAVDRDTNSPRLSYPLTYWNGLGLLAAIGIVLAFHLATSLSERPGARVAGSAVLPLLAATLVLTLSRGAIVAGVIGFVAYVALGRPRGLLSGLIAAAPAALAALLSYDAPLLTASASANPAATAEGHKLALALAGCVVAAGALRAILLPLDSMLARIRLPAVTRTRAWRAGTALAVTIAIAGLFFALDGRSYVSSQYARFVDGNQVNTKGDIRARLTDPGNNGRLDVWKVAIDGWKDARLAGHGAGTYELRWAQRRPRTPNALLRVKNAHSVYLEALYETGVVGLLLLAAALIAIFLALARGMRGRRRTVYAALTAAGVAWAAHAGVDWDWEMPAVTIWLFAAGGAALAPAPRDARDRPRTAPAGVRAAAVLGVMTLAAVPALVALSQSRLTAAIAAFKRGDCAVATREANRSMSPLARAEAMHVRAYCELRAGRPLRAVRDMERAVGLDPENWEMAYSLAVARGAAGMDPRGAAPRANQLNPAEVLTEDVVVRFESGGPTAWREQALLAPLPPRLSSGRHAAVAAGTR